MTLRDFARLAPDAPVRLHFRSESGKDTGTLVMPAERAVNPCRSGRYFPAFPSGGVPYWYAEELVGWERVR